MSLNYSRPLPKDSGSSEAMQEYPSPVLSVRTLATDNAVTSSVVTLSDKTTMMEITAIGAPAVIKWIATTNTNPSVISAAGTANFDHVIPAGTLRRFVVPRESAAITSIAGANIQEGLYQRVAWKTSAAASILSTEY